MKTGAELVKMNLKKESQLFQGFLWKIFSENNPIFYFPQLEGTEIFLNAKKRFPDKLKIFSRRVGDGKCITLQELVNSSVRLGNLETSTVPTGIYGFLENVGPTFKITSQIWLDNKSKENYLQNKDVIDYLFELYKN